MRLAKVLIGCLFVSLFVSPFFGSNDANGLRVLAASPERVATASVLADTSTVTSSTVVDGGSTVSLTGKITIADGTPVTNATISFALVTGTTPVYRTVYTNAEGIYSIDLKPGDWYWMITGHNPAAPYDNLPFTTARASQPALPWSMNYGSTYTVEPIPKSKFDIELPTGSLEINAKDNLDQPLPYANIYYSAAANPLGQCTDSDLSISATYCQQINSTDINGRADVPIYLDNCDLCLDQWHKFQGWIPTIHNIPLTQQRLYSYFLDDAGRCPCNENTVNLLASERMSDTSTGSIYISDRKNPAWYAKYKVGQELQKTISLPDSVSVEVNVNWFANGYKTESFSEAGLAAAETGSVATNIVVHYATDEMGFSSMTTRRVNSDGKVNFYATPNDSGALLYQLLNPDSSTVDIESMDLLTQASTRNLIFPTGFYDVVKIDNAKSTFYKKLPNFRRVNVQVKESVTDLPLQYGVVTGQGVIADGGCGFSYTFICRQNDSQPLQLDQSGNAHYFAINDGNEVPNTSPIIVDSRYQSRSSNSSNISLSYDTTTATSSVSIRIAMPPGVSISGNVMTRDGTPISGAFVGLANESGLSTSYTDNNGNYSMLVDEEQIANFNPATIFLKGFSSLALRTFTACKSESSLYCDTPRINSSSLPIGYIQGEPKWGSWVRNGGALSEFDYSVLTSSPVNFIVPKMHRISVELIDPITNSKVTKVTVAGLQEMRCNNETQTASISGLRGKKYDSLRLGTPPDTRADVYDARLLYQPPGYGICRTDYLETQSDEFGNVGFAIIDKSDLNSGLAESPQAYKYRVYETSNPARFTYVTFDGTKDEAVTVRLPAPPPPPEAAEATPVSLSDSGTTTVDVEFTPPSEESITATSEDLGVDGYIVEAVPIVENEGALRVSKSKKKRLSSFRSVPAIQSARITTSPTSIVTSLDSLTTTTRLEGLVYGTRYKILVRGWNEAGMGKSRQVILNNGYVAPPPPPPPPPAPRRETRERTPTPTPTPTPSATATPTPTPVVSVTATPSPTPTISATPVATPSVSTRPTASVLPKSIERVEKTTEAKVAIAKPATSLSNAPTLAVVTGKAFAPVANSLPSRTTLKVSVTIGGKSFDLGSVRVDSKGNAVLPPLVAKKAGTLVIQMTDKSGKKYFLKVAVGKKK